MGLTSAGYIRTTEAERLTTLRDSWRSEFGAGTDVSDDSPDGHIVRILSSGLASIEEAIEAVYQVIDPASAAGTALDNLCRILGISRNQATASVVGVDLTGTAGTLVPAGTLFEISGTGSQWELDADVTLDGSGEGSGTASCTTLGSVECAIGALDTIASPVSGLTSVENTAAAILGTDLETDRQLRARRTRSLSGTGRSTLDSMVARLLDLDGVTTAQVFENATDSTISSRPPHSFEVLADGGDQDAIAEVIWKGKPAGVAMYGSTTVSYSDSQGTARSIKFTRPSTVNIWISATLTGDGDLPSGATTLIKQALLRLTEADDAEILSGDATTGFLIPGADVIYGKIVGAIYSIPGVVSGSVYIGTSSSPVGTSNITIGETQKAELAISRMVISV